MPKDKHYMGEDFLQDAADARREDEEGRTEDEDEGGDADRYEEDFEWEESDESDDSR